LIGTRLAPNMGDHSDEERVHRPLAHVIHQVLESTDHGLPLLTFQPEA
jgi:hypothetical protein